MSVLHSTWRTSRGHIVIAAKACVHYFLACPRNIKSVNFNFAVAWNEMKKATLANSWKELLKWINQFLWL